MSNILQIGYTTEGTTDQRFLSNVIRKAFEHVIFECNSVIEIYDPEYLPKPQGGFVSQIKNIALNFSYFHVICIHCDSDNPSIELVLQKKIHPAIKAVNKIDEACKNLISIIPVQMTEAWLLADLDLLKSKIGTDKSNIELGLPTNIAQIEGYANPKDVISEAIRLAQEHLSKRRRKISISNLYSPVSQEISIDILSQLPSFNRFLEEVRKALKYLNYLN
jgi:hypothetical protein